MKKISFLRVLFFFGLHLFIFYGCVSVDSLNNSNTIKAKLDNNARDLIDTTLFKSRKIIVLETINQSFISSITRILTFKDTLFIYDEKNQKVIVFNDSGKYISTIEKRGQGPAEYVQMTDVCFDKSTKQLIFLCSVPHKLMYFDLRGKFIKEQPLDFLFSELKADKEYIYLKKFSTNNNLPNLYSIYVMNKKSQIITEKLPAIEEINTISAGGKELVSGRDILYSRRFDNKVYQLKNGEVKPIYTLDFGKGNLPDAMKSNQYSPNDFTNACSSSNVIYSITNAFDTDNYLFFTTNLTFVYSLSKRTNAIKQYPSLFDSEIKIGKSNYIPVEGDNTCKIAVEYKVGFLKSSLNMILTHTKEIGIYKKRQDLTNLLSDDANPVLFIYELK